MPSLILCSPPCAVRLWAVAVCAQVAEPAFRFSAATAEAVAAAVADDITIHHSPDKYVRQDGADAEHNFGLTLEALLAWLATCPAHVPSAAAGA